MAMPNFKGAGNCNLSSSWREENQEFLVNSTKCLPQTLHKPDTIMNARDTKMNGMYPSPREITFLGNNFI